MTSLDANWVDRLEIRDMIERGMRLMDDGDGDGVARLFAEDGVFHIAGLVYEGREAIRGMFPHPTPKAWTEPGQLFLQPRAAHWSSNPVVDVDRDTATAETDMIVVKRDDQGRAKITLVARYRDRLRRAGDRWEFTSRTGVSIARPGEEGTDSEWRRALEGMDPELRARVGI
jgi:uncharacterized protein (TIGR02246 family)